MDFGFNKGGSSASSAPQNGNADDTPIDDLNGDGVKVDGNGNSIAAIDNNPPAPVPTPVVDPAKDNNNNGDNKDANKDDKDDNTSQHDLVEGTSLELDGQTYTVDKNGNVVDSKGEVYKEAKDVKDWLKELDVTSDDNALDVSNIQNAIGIEIVDDNDKPVVYENTVEGITSYIKDVLETKRAENYETAINTYHQKYPIINDVLNYYIANGNSLEGFNEVPDRSGITVDENNVAQQEAIIREAYKENNMKGDVESYIQYLKSSNILFSTAQAELQGLQTKDAEYKQYIEKQAEDAENARIESLTKYWNDVKQVVDSKVISGYQIPDTIVVNRNGQKITATPNDFYNYIYQVDANGKSAYENELAASKPEDRMNDELLRAYLKFVGGDYSSLVGMAVNKDKVTSLKLKSKTGKNASSIKITQPTAPKSGVNVDLGYN